MNRVVLLIVALIAVAIGLFVLLNPLEVEGPEPSSPTAAPAPPAEAPPDPPPAPAKAEPVTAEPEKAEPRETEPDPAEPELEDGPFRYSLGNHRISLKERDGRYLQVEVTLVTSDRETRKEIPRRRRALVRMLYFLVSHRSADAVTLADGPKRLGDDLMARYRNVLRSPLDTLEMNTFKVVEGPVPQKPLKPGEVREPE